MKIVELEIKQTYKVQVVVPSEGLSEDEVIKAAQDKAEGMDHGSWEYRETEYDAVNVLDLPEGFSQDHITLLQFGYPVEKLKKYTDEDALAEIEALGSLA